MHKLLTTWIPLLCTNGCAVFAYTHKYLRTQAHTNKQRLFQYLHLSTPVLAPRFPGTPALSTPSLSTLVALSKNTHTRTEVHPYNRTPVHPYLHLYLSVDPSLSTPSLSTLIHAHINTCCLL